MLLMAERIEKHRRGRHAKVLERIEGHYESEKVPFGRAYRWCTKGEVAECGCGESMILTGSITTCAGCGTDYTAIVQEWLPAERAEADESLHPWRHARDCEGESLPS